MSAKLLWSGWLDGVLICGFLDVAHVRRRADPSHCPFLETLVLPESPLFRFEKSADIFDRPEFRAVLCNWERYSELPYRPFSAETVRRMGSTIAYELIGVDAPRNRIVLGCRHAGSCTALLAWSCEDGELSLLAPLDDNHHFDRFYSMAPDGVVVAVSDMGSEYVDGSGRNRTPDWQRFSPGGLCVSCGPSHFVVGLSGQFGPIQMVDYGGNVLGEIPGFAAAGKRFGFHHSAEHHWPALRMSLDRLGRIWVAGANLVVLSPQGELLYASEPGEIAVGYRIGLFSFVGLVGVDALCRAWCYGPDGYYAYELPGISLSGNEPTLPAEPDRRTGLEPTL